MGAEGIEEILFWHLPGCHIPQEGSWLTDPGCQEASLTMSSTGQLCGPRQTLKSVLGDTLPLPGPGASRLWAQPWGRETARGHENTAVVIALELRPLQEWEQAGAGVVWSPGIDSEVRDVCFHGPWCSHP